MDSDHQRRFFAKRVENILPPEFSRDLEDVEWIVNTMSKREILERYSELGTRTVSIEFVKPYVFLVRSEDMYGAAMKGYIAPSMFIKYRWCARALVIELLNVEEHGGVLVTIDSLRSMLRGILMHKLYYEKYAVGETTELAMGL